MNPAFASKITGLVITLNEEKNIQAVIDNLHFADEIIIVDSFSTDGTREIAENNTKIRFVQNAFTDYAAQRNFALSLASHPWILFLDADERLTPELEKEILTVVQNPDACDAYYFYRKFYFGEKPMHFSGLQTDKNIRLFKRTAGTYATTRLVHEILEVNGKTGILKNKLIHYSYSDYETYKSKTLAYARLKAKELQLKNLKPTAFHFYFKPFFRFSFNYFIRLGFLDGRAGWTICYLNALGVHHRYKELDALQQSSKL